jgi:hypothetical protein
MSKIYRCKQCRRTIPRQEELRAHLHWHKITATDVDAYFTEEADDAEVASPAVEQPAAEKARKGVMGWLRRK